MVVQCGFSKALGQVAWQQQGGQTFVGQQMGQSPNCSAQTADQIDAEVKEIVDKAYRCVSDECVGLCRGATRGFSKGSLGLLARAAWG